MNGLFGGAFDPPHNAHVELLRAARQVFALDTAVVLVAAAPAHKRVVTPVEIRLALARAAFPDSDVRLDVEPRTVDTLRTHPEWAGSVFLLGADEFSGLLGWKEPEELLRSVRLGVATRPGYPRDQLETVLHGLELRDRVSFFDLDPMPIASRELRDRLDRGENVEAFVPERVWEIIERDGLYGRGYTRNA